MIKDFTLHWKRNMISKIKLSSAYAIERRKTV